VHGGKIPLPLLDLSTKKSEQRCLFVDAARASNIYVIAISSRAIIYVYVAEASASEFRLSRAFVKTINTRGTLAKACNSALK
jgi:hypothetical protein